MDESQWELSKENIQPIKQGRKASILTTILNEPQQRKLNIERQEFEKELRSYTGDDPLDIWYKYALWVEQNYPKGGNEGNLMKLIESCFSALGSTEFFSKYKNDSRYLDLWMKYISHCPCPLEVYQTLNAKNMFVELSSFFENWAWEMEKIGNLKQANAIYLEGIQKKAKPISNMEMAYSKFQARVFHLTLEGLTNEEGENGESEVRRKAFAALKPRGAKAKAPNERVLSVVGTAGRFPSAPPTVNASAPIFKIFKDENETCDEFSVGENPSVQNFTSQSASSKENMKNPSTWNKNKARQKTTQNIPVEDVNRFGRPGFNVHVDDSAEKECHSRGGKPSDLTGILCAKKATKDNWHVPLFIPEPFNPYSCPQYCKQLVYCGAEEFSFEELRAIAVKRKEERLKKEKVQQEQAVIQDQLKILQERLLQHEQLMRLLMQKKDGNSLDVPGDRSKSVERGCSNPTVIVSDAIETQVDKEKSLAASTARLYEDSYVVINKSVSITANATLNASHGWDESSTDMLSLQPVIQKQHEVSFSSLGSRAESAANFSQSNNTSSKECNRSLTVNTKFAQNLVLDMFNGTIFHNSTSSGSLQGPTATALSEHVQPQYQKQADVVSPFVIYEDKTDEGLNKAGVSAPFSIYCDENADIVYSSSRSSVPYDENDGPGAKRRPLEQLALLDKKKDEVSNPEGYAPVQICPDENDDCAHNSKMEPFRPSLALLHDGDEVPFQAYSSENRMPSLSSASNDDEENQEFNPKRGFKNQWKRGDESAKNLLNDENQENIPPKDYQQTTEKRSFAGVLQPSKDIFFIPLEEQKDEDAGAGDDEMEGVAPLSEGCVPDEFTTKVPANREVFAQMSFVASTPRPWSLGLVPQVVQEGDDFTMAAIIKSRKKSFDKEEMEDSPISVEGGDKSGENSGDLMLPPSKFEAPGSATTLSPNQDKAAVTNTTDHTNKTRLSPILEASREYRSSSSSSSGNITTFGAHSNFHGMTRISQVTMGSAAKIVKFSSQHKRFSCTENESYGGVDQDDPSKSGYFADKSNGESINEESAKKQSARTLSTAHTCNLDSSFDPDKIAGDFLKMDLDINDMEPLKRRSQPPPLPSAAKGKDMQGMALEKMTLTISPLQKTIKYAAEIDPFCPVLQKRILNALRVPVEESRGYVPLNMKIPHIKPKTRVNLGKELYQVRRLIGSGAYAHVFHASTLDPMNVTFFPGCLEDDGEEENQMILKVQKPSSLWEFYVCHELRERLKRRNSPEALLNAFMRINRGYFLPQGSILVSQFHKHGTLLDVVNKYKKCGKSVPENLVFFLMSEVVLCLNALHSCNIIHGDLKPDNVLLVHVPSTSSGIKEVTAIKLIDFGRSIDMEVLPRNAEFTRRVKTDGFTCCEMRDGRPWTFQTDYYGLAAIAHIMLWGAYMNVRKEGSEWKLFGVNYYRYMQKFFWQRFFSQMLNIPSCRELPDLNEVFNNLRNQFNPITFTSEVQMLSTLLTQN